MYAPNCARCTVTDCCFPSSILYKSPSYLQSDLFRQDKADAEAKYVL